MNQTTDITTSCHNYWAREYIPHMIKEVLDQINRGTNKEKEALKEYMVHLNAIQFMSEVLGNREFTFSKGL